MESCYCDYNPPCGYCITHEDCIKCGVRLHIDDGVLAENERDFYCDDCALRFLKRSDL